MPSEATLAWALVDVVSTCFTPDDRLGIYTALGAGETYSAISGCSSSRCADDIGCRPLSSPS